jgi:hypothetical protein
VGKIVLKRNHNSYSRRVWTAFIRFRTEIDEDGSESWASSKSEELLDQLSDCHLLKTAPVIWILPCTGDIFLSVSLNILSQ